MVDFPADWTPDYPDQETLMLDLIQPWLDELGTGNLAVTWLPDNYVELIDGGTVIVRVHRLGGGLHDRVLDTGTLQLVVATSKREWSSRITAVLRDRLAGIYPQEMDGTPIARISEMTGPLEIPDLSPDPRLVQSLYQMTCRKTR